MPKILDRAWEEALQPPGQASKILNYWFTIRVEGQAHRSQLLPYLQVAVAQLRPGSTADYWSHDPVVLSWAHSIFQGIFSNVWRCF